MNRILTAARLHLNKPQIVFSSPAQIIGAVLILSAIVAFALQRAGNSPLDADYAMGARMNSGMVWSLPGFLIYYGVQAIATTFPFALALGLTRRAYVLGTALVNLIMSVYITALMLALLGIELAEGHWCFGLYVLVTYALGAGDPWVLAATVFLGTFLCTSIGGLFGAVWVRFGSRGPLALGLGLGLVLVLALLVFAPRLAQILSGVTSAGLALGVALASVLAVAGTWLAMSRAAVR